MLTSLQGEKRFQLFGCRYKSLHPAMLYSTTSAYWKCKRFVILRQHHKDFLPISLTWPTKYYRIFLLALFLTSFTLSPTHSLFYLPHSHILASGVLHVLFPLTGMFFPHICPVFCSFSLFRTPFKLNPHLKLQHRYPHPSTTHFTFLMTLHTK